VGAVFGLASVLGPLIGGLLTDNAGGILPGVEGWRWVFCVNVPVGALALWFIVGLKPRLEPTGERAVPDLIGGALLLGGLIPLVLSLQLDKLTYPWTSPVTLGLFAFGAALLTAFVLRSRRAASPILDMRLFSERVFRTANASTFFFGASFMSVTIFLPLFLVNVLGVSATRAGAALIPFSLGIVFSATLAGQIVHRVGYRRPIVLGALIFGIVAVMLARMGPDVSYGSVTLYMVLAGVGVGPGMPLFTLAIQNAVDVRLVGQATSASQFFRQTGATVGAALMGTVLASTLALSFATLELPEALREREGASVEELVSTGGAGLPGRIDAVFAELAAQAGDPEEASALMAQGSEVSQRVADEVREAFSLATSRIYWLTVVLSCLALALALRIPELPLRTTHDRAALEPSPAAEGP
jgi:MFS family permease